MIQTGLVEGGKVIIDKIGMYFIPGEWKLHPPKVNQALIRELFMAVERDRQGRFQGVYDEDIVDMQVDSWRKRVGIQRKVWSRCLEMKPGPKFGGF